MLLYNEWLGRAVQFFESMKVLSERIEVGIKFAPPLLEGELEGLQKNWRLRMPLPIRRFLTQGSGHCDCNYFWEPPKAFQEILDDIFNLPSSDLVGAVEFLEPNNIEHALAGCFDTGFSLGESGLEKERRFWQSSFPFSSLGNGDYLALYMDPKLLEENFPVVYLCHEWHHLTDTDRYSGVIDANFDTFLIHLEELCYLHGGDITLFRDPPYGHLNSQSLKAIHFRKFVADALAQGK